MQNSIKHNEEVINQSICAKLVDREVLHPLNYLMEALLANVEGDKINEYQEELFSVLYRPTDEDEDEDEEGLEAMEFWAVTEHMARKLSEQGEAVAEIFDFHVWGRTTSGQAISVDRVITDIASDMEILAGQKYSWE